MSNAYYLLRFLPLQVSSLYLSLSVINCSLPYLSLHAPMLTYKKTIPKYLLYVHLPSSIPTTRSIHSVISALILYGLRKKDLVCSLALSNNITIDYQLSTFLTKSSLTYEKKLV